MKTIFLFAVGIFVLCFSSTIAQTVPERSPDSRDILLKGIELANDCDLKYKSSQNQRLLVELCLMQLASITFDGEKKKLTDL